MSSNSSTYLPITPAPACTLVPQASLISGIPDNVLAIRLPTIVYAVAGSFFHFFDTYQLFSSHRIHHSEDGLKRNRVTKWQCLQGVLRYHGMQTATGLLLSYGGSPVLVGDETCQIHLAASVTSRFQKLVPIALGILGIDAKRLRIATKDTSTWLAQTISVQDMPGYMTSDNLPQRPSFTSLEVLLAKIVVFFGIAAIQYLVALAVVDPWIYFTHRLCRVNKALYRTFHKSHPVDSLRSPHLPRCIPTHGIRLQKRAY